MSNFHTLKGVDQTGFGGSTISTQVRENLISFFSWGLLEAGAYGNVRIPTSGLYGGDNHKLHLVADPNYSNGKVWRGFRKNWVWETGIYREVPPINISGVYVNSSFHPSTGIGPYSHRVDYKNGQVIFNSAISPTSLVCCEYSYKIVDVLEASTDFVKKAQFDTFDSSSSDLARGSGDHIPLPSRTIQFPVIAVELINRVDFQGMELGGGNYLYQDVDFYVVAEDIVMRDRLKDVILSQYEKSLLFYNIDGLVQDQKYPLNVDGTLNPSGIRSYPVMISDPSEGGYQYKKVWISEADTTSLNMFNTRLYGATVRLTLSISMPQI
jgi:hypothetical protein